jgi:hypothetical protein
LSYAKENRVLGLVFVVVVVFTGSSAAVIAIVFREEITLVGFRERVLPFCELGFLHGMQ